jgi:hypothetical protein
MSIKLSAENAPSSAIKSLPLQKLVLKLGTTVLRRIDEDYT